METLEEGVKKFKEERIGHQPVEHSRLIKLNMYREYLYLTWLVGQDPERYGGAGYGNVSKRIDTYIPQKNKNKFIITGSQTGGLKILMQEHYTTILEYYPEENRVVSNGPIEASSESMTHGTIYDECDSCRYVFHVHSPLIWRNSKRLGIPSTKKEVEYGTPEMAEEVKRLFRETNAKEKGVFTAAGHEDGMFFFGKSGKDLCFKTGYYMAKSALPVLL